MLKNICDDKFSANISKVFPHAIRMSLQYMYVPYTCMYTGQKLPLS